MKGEGLNKEVVILQRGRAYNRKQYLHIYRIENTHTPRDNQIPPHSHRPSPAKQNYDIGNKELLAVKLALEEWRQWLEGAQVPFLVWTDHKNLEYLQTAKRLNSHQAMWALFFSKFNFHLVYRPGAKNIKPDALSRYFEDLTKDNEPDTILRPEVFIHAIEIDMFRRPLALILHPVMAQCEDSSCLKTPGRMLSSGVIPPKSPVTPVLTEQSHLSNANSGGRWWGRTSRTSSQPAFSLR